MRNLSIDNGVRWWLFIGVVMVFFQVVLGGITRLTDSGLSITDWAVIQGVLPPFGEQAWEEAFAAYKQAAAKQYETLHRGMGLQEFKRIYYWEYLHRLWARSMGLVFLVPFLWFWSKGRMPSFLMKKLIAVLFLALLAAIFGWIMVKSGLNNDQRTWVSAYKLVVHLLIATGLFAYLFWIWRTAGRPEREESRPRIYPWLKLVLAMVFVQLALGGLMAGMRAAMVFPFFPAVGGMHNLLALLEQQSRSGIDWSNFIDYEPSIWIKAWVQLLHRSMAWLILAFLTLLLWKNRNQLRHYRLSFHIKLLISVLIAQMCLGIFTVINSLGRIPLALGVLHQAGALLLIAALLYLMAALRYKEENKKF